MEAPSTWETGVGVLMEVGWAARMIYCGGTLHIFYDWLHRRHVQFFFFSIKRLWMPLPDSAVA